MRLALSFPPSAACRFLDLPPVNLRNLHLHLTKNPFAGQPPHLCGVTLRIAAPEIRRGDPGCQKPTESSRGPKPSRLLIEPGGVYGGCGRIFAAENPIFQSKNRFLADFAPGDFEEILAKSARLKTFWVFRFRQRRNCHGSNRRFEARHLAGELAPPSTSLSKRLF